MSDTNNYHVTYSLLRAGGLTVSGSQIIEAQSYEDVVKIIQGRVQPDEILTDISVTLATNSQKIEYK